MLLPLYGRIIKIMAEANSMSNVLPISLDAFAFEFELPNILTECNAQSFENKATFQPIADRKTLISISLSVSVALVLHCLLLVLW